MVSSLVHVVEKSLVSPGASGTPTDAQVPAANLVSTAIVNSLCSMTYDSRLQVNLKSPWCGRTETEHDVFLRGHSFSRIKTPSSWCQSTAAQYEQPNARYSSSVDLPWTFRPPDVVCLGNHTAIRPRCPLSANPPNSFFPSRARYLALTPKTWLECDPRMLVSGHSQARMGLKLNVCTQFPAKSRAFHAVVSL